MSNKKQLTQEQLDHQTDQNNANKGTPGQNLPHSQVHGNRGKQMNPNRKNK